MTLSRHESAVLGSCLLCGLLVIPSQVVAIVLLHFSLASPLLVAVSSFGLSVSIALEVVGAWHEVLECRRGRRAWARLHAALDSDPRTR